MIMGWNTMTSPLSSPRISMRSVSRLSSILPIRRDYTMLVHGRCRHRRERFVIVVVPEERHALGRRFVLTETGEQRNRARVVVQLQHRQHLEAFALVHVEAQNDQGRLLALDVRVGVGI